MNRDLFGYKLNFVTLVLLLGFVYMHQVLTGFYLEALPEKLIEFSASLPFSQRLLMPALGHLLAKFLPLNAQSIFLLLDWLVAYLLYVSLQILLKNYLTPKVALGLTWLFFLLLPLVYVVNYRFSIGGIATFYYPYDLATLLLMTLGLNLCLQERWTWYIPLIIVAALNRESAILLVLLIPALHWQQRQKHWKIALFALAAYGLTHVLVFYLANHQPGTWAELYQKRTQLTHFYFNVMWVFRELDWLMIFFGLAGLPLFWFAFYDYVPKQLRPLKYVALVYFLGLSLVGNLLETRVYGEIVMLLYVPVCLAMTGWVRGDAPEIMPDSGLWYWMDRYFVIGVLTVVFVFYQPINRLLVAIIQKITL